MVVPRFHLLRETVHMGISHSMWRKACYLLSRAIGWAKHNEIIDAFVISRYLFSH
jgi:hypothetical protein